jgi:hypothetical protein
MNVDSPTSKAELQEALTILIRKSYQNDVAIGGAYELRSPEQTIPDWECVCTRLK